MGIKDAMPERWGDRHELTCTRHSNRRMAVREFRETKHLTLREEYFADDGGVAFCETLTLENDGSIMLNSDSCHKDECFRRKVDTKEFRNLISRHFDRHARVWVNAYAVNRVCYSPAEGGCYADVAEAVASAPVLDRDDRPMEVAAHMFEALRDEYDDGRNRFSVLGGADLIIRFEKKAAENWPQEPLRYE